jgi:site-specific DNA-methyltransferase (adenine-specific)
MLIHKDVQMVQTILIKPWDRNPRINDDSVAAVVASIKTFGFTQPIVVNQDDIICAGHTRYKAAVQLGMEEVPVVRVTMSPSEFKAYNLADNKTNQRSSWDDEQLRVILKELHAEDFDLTLTAFEDKEIAALINVNLEEEKKLKDQLEEGSKDPAAPEESHVKMVQFFLNKEQFEAFTAKADRIQAHLGKSSLSEVIYEVVSAYTLPES